jgi:hypothetical protein
MPTHMRQRFSTDELKSVQLAEPFSFTKGCQTMRFDGLGWRGVRQLNTMLFDLEADPQQAAPIEDAAVEARMVDLMVRLMKENDAPAEQFARLGL